MKCLVIGHTKGIGNAIYNFLKDIGFDVDGISRETGYDFSKNYNDILTKAQSVDLVINNAYFEDYQCRLLIDLKDKVKHIISIGSIAGYYSNILSKKHQYSKNKKNLIDVNRRLSYSSSTNFLLLNIGLTENASLDPGCTYQDIINACKFWLENPNINQIDFKFKLSNVNTKLIEDDFGIKLQDHRNYFF